MVVRRSSEVKATGRLQARRSHVVLTQTTRTAMNPTGALPNAIATEPR